MDAVIAEGGRRGVHFRYVLPYDAIAKRYMAEYGQRERREGYGISPTLAEALYELAENHKIEIMIEKTRYKTYYYAVVDGVRIEDSLCYRESLRGCISEVLRRVKEQREWEEQLRRQRIREEVLNALTEWYFRCFGETANPLKVAKRLEEYFALCQMRSAAKREFGVAPTERALRGAFWWEGEWRGKPMSCFVTGRKAVCKVGDKKAAFYVFDTPHGVYLRPEIKLVDDWIKVAHRGDEGQGG
ncbi:PaRep2a protein [Pyrobaculum aerophilum]|uniref:PaRep2a protein n=1 Tax=Pyrobaculum aerophilum TaxID=13773 RepID=UPI0021612ED5|nr:PaRep2a protein [Pyrobaculum aerophilum]